MWITGALLMDPGLANSNRVTSDGLSQLLFAVQQEPYFDTFFDSLPVAGNSERMVGGTLRKRLTATHLKTVFLQKRGTSQTSIHYRGISRGIVASNIFFRFY